MEVTDHNKKIGNSKRSWKYYEEMEESIGGNSSVNPQYTLESSSTPGPSDNISSSSDDEIQGTHLKRRHLLLNALLKTKKQILGGRDARFSQRLPTTARGGGK